MPNPIVGNDLTLAITIQDSSGSALTLGGASVACKVLDPTGLHISLTPTVTDASTGKISVALSPAQTATAGSYRLSSKVTFNDGRTTETDALYFTISPALF